MGSTLTTDRAVFRFNSWPIYCRLRTARRDGLYLKKSGRVCQIETDGEGLYLEPASGK